MSIDIGKTVGELTAEETEEMATRCLIDMHDTAAINVIVEYICGDQQLRDELIADLEKI